MIFTLFNFVIFHGLKSFKIIKKTKNCFSHFVSCSILNNYARDLSAEGKQDGSKKLKI